MKGILTTSLINDINNINSNINNINSNINNINENINNVESNINIIQSSLNNKANQYYNYKFIQSIPENSDFNNYLTVGSYTMTTASGASTLKNKPSAASAGTLHVIDVLSDADTLTKLSGHWEYFMQIYIDYQNKIFTRLIHNNNGSMNYGDWNQL